MAKPQGAPRKPSRLLFHSVSWLCYYLLPFATLVFILIQLSLGNSVYDFVVFTGRLSFLLLAVILFSKPLAVILNWKILDKFLGYRRQLGVLTFWFAVFHGMGLLFLLNLFSGEGFARLVNLHGPALPGLLGLFGMILLGITSNNFSVIKLGSHRWKHIQLLAYPVFFFTSLHYYRIDGNILHWAVFIGYLLLKGLQHYFHERHDRERKDLLSYNQFMDLPDELHPTGKRKIS
jgi:sulfoxide reductase heme-binding subunit YedZ